MIINKKIAFLSLAIIAIFSLAVTVRAESGNDNGKSEDGQDMMDEGSQDRGVQMMRNADFGTSTDEDASDNGSDESSEVRDRNATSSERSQGEEHRSEMSDIMEKLGKIADRDARVGDDLDEIVKELKEAEEKTAKAIDEVEKRDSLKTFFFGTDYKNLGELRSTIMTTENHIERLTRAMVSTTDATVRSGLSAQIEALKNTASSTEVFIRDNEGKFSLFGWFVRIFQN